MRLRNPELHAAVLAAPDDDAPRMVYADWLIERGDPRGELIARMLRGADVTDLRGEQLEWERGFKNVGVTWSRGFIESLSGKANWMENLDLGDACVRELGVGSWVYSADVSEVVLHMLTEVRLRRLVLSGPQDHHAFEVLTQSPHLAGVEAFALSVQLTDERMLAALLAARLPSLTSLDVSACGLDGSRLRRIAERFGLRELDISVNQLGPGVLGSQLRAPGLRALERLDASYTGIDDDDVVALARSELPLRRLELCGNKLGRDAFRALASSPWSARLAYLDIHDAGLTREGLADLMASPHLSRELELGLDGMVLGLHPNIEYDSEDVRCGGYWTRDPPAEVAARFCVTVLGDPP